LCVEAPRQPGTLGQPWPTTFPDNPVLKSPIDPW
jgi:hypothetical protein